MKTSKIDQFDIIYAADCSVWRDWLAANHAASPGIWLVYYKKNSEKASVSYDEAVEEALCFGWIDSLMHPIDEERYKQVFTPRKPGSRWSRLNKQRVEKMIAEGRMTASGLEKIEEAQRDGSWTMLDDVENLVLPEELTAALSANPTAQANFQALTNSLKKQVLAWLHDARRPETRQARIAQAITNLGQGRHPITGAERRSRSSDPS